MSVKEDVKALFGNLLGAEVAKQLDGFDDPDKYPKDFLDECIDFLSKFIGEDAAKKKLDAIVKKYGRRARGMVHRRA